MEYDHMSPHTTFCPLFGWDLHTLEVFNANMPALTMEFPFSSPGSTTGYLQDAIADLSCDGSTKRRRVVISSDHDQTTILEPENQLVQNYLNWSFSEEYPVANERSWSDNTTVVLGDPNLSSSINSISIGTTVSMERIETQEATTTSENEQLSFSPSSNYNEGSLTYNDPDVKESPASSRDPLSSDSQYFSKRKMIAAGKRVAYPFAVVKPGKHQGDVTLDDINERILMRPTRPVRHPVGEFACHPLVSGDGPGLSGKAVVAFTRIHTQGRGSITIIRTRG